MRYGRHPDRLQEAFFFALLKECLDAGDITRAQIEAEMAQDHVRHDALELVERVPPVDEVLGKVHAAA